MLLVSVFVEAAAYCLGLPRVGRVDWLLGPVALLLMVDRVIAVLVRVVRKRVADFVATVLLRRPAAVFRVALLGVAYRRVDFVD